MRGSLTFNDYIKLIKTKKIITSENATKRIQPASMDLTLSNECYELKYSFLCPKGTIRNKENSERHSY